MPNAVFDNVDDALTISFLARVPAAIKLRQVAWEVLLAHMVEGADDIAQRGVLRFDLIPVPKRSSIRLPPNA